MFLYVLKILLFSLIFISDTLSKEIQVFEFTEKELSILKVRKIRGADAKTKYSLEKNE